MLKKGGDCLTHPTHNPIITDPQPKLRAVTQPPLPGHPPMTQSRQNRESEPYPEKRRLTLPKALSGKFYYLSWWEEKRKEREEQGNAITLLNTTCLSLGGGGTSKGRDEIRQEMGSILQGLRTGTAKIAQMLTCFSCKCSLSTAPDPSKNGERKDSCSPNLPP